MPTKTDKNAASRSRLTWLVKTGELAHVEAELAGGSKPTASAIAAAIDREHRGIFEAVLKAARGKLDTLDIGLDAPLVYAVRHSSSAWVVESLLKAGADPDGKKPRGDRYWTPLTAAIDREIHCKKAEITKIILDAGADVELPDKSGIRPLHSATQSVEIMKLLVERGADVNSVDANGDRPLDYAIEDNGEGDAAFESILFLLRAGANPDAENAAGRSPRDVDSKTIERAETTIAFDKYARKGSSTLPKENAFDGSLSTRTIKLECVAAMSDRYVLTERRDRSKY